MNSFLALIFSLFCTVIFAQVNDEFFDVTNTSSESWSGGVYGSGSHTNYTFVVKFKKDVKISFDTIWDGNKPRLASGTNYENGIKGNFKKNDLVVIVVRISHPGQNSILYNEDQSKDAKYKNPVPDCNCYFLLQYYVNNVKYYYGVKKIDKETDHEIP